MGSAQGKATNDTLPATPTKQNAPDNISAIYAIASSLNNLSHDPRSPAYQRSPMASPFDTPCSTPPSVARARMLQRLGSASKFGALDPRSPASKRTPMREVVSNEGRTLPPPFSLGVSYGDPRSPSIVTRTPLAGSTQDDIVVVPDDIVVAEEVVCDIENDEAAARASTDSSVKGVEPMSLERETSEGADSMCGKVTVETFSSPEYTPSPAIMALAMSPLNSPISARKRKDLRKGPTLSPLKKSYSAPIDENFTPNPPSPSMKARTRVMQPRTPLSPLTNSRHCMGVQPIKLRMDPAILG